MSIEAVRSIVSGLTARVVPANIVAGGPLEAAAMTYALSYTGNFGFMLDMRDAARRYARLTPAQAAGTLNCARADFARRAAVQPTANDLHLGTQANVLAPIKNEVAPAVAPSRIEAGTYTVVMGNDVNNYRTLRLQAPKPGTFSDLPAGTLIVGYLSGPDNERNFTNFGFLFADGRVVIWNAHRNSPGIQKVALALGLLIEANGEGRAAMGLAYAIKSSRCYRCGRVLTVPTSIHAGLGPECAQRVG